jgi:hypothetical protein
MNDRVLKLYHRLPAPIRFIAASLRGLYLHSWCYSMESERLIAEALEREHWSPERWKGWQEERLAYVLHGAATHVPYYREQWAHVVDKAIEPPGNVWKAGQSWRKNPSGTILPPL